MVQKPFLSGGLYGLEVSSKPSCSPTLVIAGAVLSRQGKVEKLGVQTGVGSEEEKMQLKQKGSLFQPLLSLTLYLPPKGHYRPERPEFILQLGHLLVA